MRTTVLIGFICIMQSFARSQTTFQARYGGSGNDFSVDVIAADNNSTLLLSNTNSFGQGGFDLMITKIDQYGGVIWNRTYGGGQNDYGHDLSLAANGDILIAGHTESYGVGSLDLFILRLAPNGALEWGLSIGGPGAEYSRAAPIELPSGNIIVSGYTESFGFGAKDIYLAKLNSSGTLMWTKVLGQGGDDDWLEAAYLMDPNEVLLGGRLDSQAGSEKAGIVSIDSTGTVNWAKTYASAGESKTIRFLKMPNGDFVSCTATEAFSAGSRDMMLMRMDPLGNVIWTTVFGGPSDDAGTTNLSLFGSGNILLSGHTESFGSGTRDLMLATFDGVGNLLWTKNYGGSGDDAANWGGSSFLDGSRIVLRGTTTSFGAQGNDIFILQADTSGISGCNEGSFTPTVITPTIFPQSVSVFSTTGGSITNPTIGTSSVILSNSILCIDSLCAPPIADFTSTVLGSLVQFQNNSSGGTSYLWDFGDGNTSMDIDPLHDYGVSGQFNVCLIATDSCGTDTTCNLVKLIDTFVFNGAQDQILIGPNPIQNGHGLNIFGLIIAKPASIEVLSMDGRAVLEHEFMVTSTISQVTIPAISPGPYVLRIAQDQMRFTSKIMVATRSTR